MNIGIFIAYEGIPDFRKEGLGRYLAYLTKGFLASENHVTIACPEWLIKPIGLLFEDNGIDIDKINLLTIDQPSIMRFFLRVKIEKKKKLRGNFAKMLGRGAFELTTKFLSITNTVAFVLISALFVVLFVVFFPLLFVFRIISSLFFRTKNLLVSTTVKTKSIFSFNALRGIVNHLAFKFTSVQKDYTEFMMRKIINNNIYALIKRINHNKCVDVWYSPFIPHPGFNQIRGTRVVNVPDLVTAVFPMGFSDKAMLAQTEKVRNTITVNKYFITYSEFVKDTTLVKDFNKPPDSVKAIKHAVNDLSKYFDIHANVQHMGFPQEINQNFARTRLNELIYRSLIPNIDNMHAYLSNFNFKDVRYIFYASQIRPHKNVINLLKAYEYILRRQYRQVKLFLTGNYMVDPDVTDYILKNRLEYDVLSFSDVSSSMLASLYAAAELVVNPTLYEGGFPFTFGEGMSVGVPSVMSRIPQTMEVMQGYGCDEFLFDPYNWKDMADTIIFALDNKDYAYQTQKPLFDDMMTRTWDTVAQEYVDAFWDFINNRQGSRH